MSARKNVFCISILLWFLVTEYNKLGKLFKKRFILAYGSEGSEFEEPHPVFVLGESPDSAGHQPERSRKHGCDMCLLRPLSL